MSADVAATIIRPAERDWIPTPGTEGASVEVLSVDADRNRVIFLFRFDPGCVLPENYHHARAVEYTISGEWEYEEGPSGPGDVTVEDEGDRHTRTSVGGAELLAILDGDRPNLLDNFMPDGSVPALDTEAFRLVDEGDLLGAMAHVGIT